MLSPKWFSLVLGMTEWIAVDRREGRTFLVKLTHEGDRREIPADEVLQADKTSRE